MLKLGFIGWRGMVGSVLMQRMQDEQDFSRFQTTFFSTSTAGKPAPQVANAHAKLEDAFNDQILKQMDVLLSCQGSDYTNKVHGRLRDKGWDGYWIDAASSLRTSPSSVLILDPLNAEAIKEAVKVGCKDFIGANCVISLAMMGLAGLLKEGLISWMSLMTYQSASGAGAAQLRELLLQMQQLSKKVSLDLSTLELCRLFLEEQRSSRLTQQALEHALAGNLLPWIDADLGDGISREEWKGEVEAKKLLGKVAQSLRIDGICVRVPVLRSHSAAVTFKLKEQLTQQQIETVLKNAHPWLKYIPNNKEASLTHLTPVAVSDTLNVAVGRLRPLRLGGEGEVWGAFVVGDQLLWGAAEPLRRMLSFIPL